VSPQVLREGGAACLAVGCGWWTDDARTCETAAAVHHVQTGHSVVVEVRHVLGDVLADTELPAILHPPEPGG
jgi:hypothetical protein